MDKLPQYFFIIDKFFPLFQTPKNFWNTIRFNTMDAKHINLLEFVRSASQFEIPIYQRNYSWEIPQCRQFWYDIYQAGSQKDMGGHFIGSVVYVKDTDAFNAPLLVIDGQQRLTTLTLLITALSASVGDREPFDGFSCEKLRNYYLTNSLEKGIMSRKLVLSETDSKTLFAIIDNRDLPENHSRRIKDNFDFFKKCLENSDDNLETVCRGLSKLLVVHIALSRRDDNPQLVFESMNSTGRELTQADLIRNYILMGLETDLQSKLYNDYWRPMEEAFGQEAYDDYFDRFMRDYLTMKENKIPRLADVYEAFKSYARHSALSIEELIQDIWRTSRHYCAMALGGETDKDLKAAFHDLRGLRVEVAYPLLLELYRDYDNNDLSREDFLKAVRLIESYIFRRAVCEIPTSSMNKTFATFGKALKKDRYLESIMAHFLLLPSYRRFPPNKEFKDKIKTRNLYNFQSRSYWLRRFENHGRKELVPVDEYTIEHIMPQNENLTDEWKTALGEDWKQTHEDYLHTLGNLTLTGYNSEYSDKPFREKRDMEGGFSNSPLRVNEGLGNLEEWTKDTITDRAKRLSEYATTVWICPEISSATLNAYQSEETNQTNYSIDDHSYSMSSSTRELFEDFRREVLRLDPCISEEILELYVVYKAETNFVDVVPEENKLKLSLNMTFPDINDPRGICNDVSNVGRWGNGDVGLILDSPSDLPYVIGLVRQSLERQLGNDSDI